jgi:sulfatase maturation enzyme AslB (radical SAM superfamily)
MESPISVPGKKNQVIDALSKLDLSNLRQLVFCGGETLLGQEYWDVAKWLADHVPNAKQQLTLCFQTNGTQPVRPENFDIIEKFYLVKLHISLDGIQDRFEYLRWPASWNQVTDNILNLRETLPGNVPCLLWKKPLVFLICCTCRNLRSGLK